MQSLKAADIRGTEETNYRKLGFLVWEGLYCKVQNLKLKEHSEMEVE